MPTILLVNASIIERAGRFTIPLLLVTLFFATFVSAQSVVLWPVAALHLTLRYKKQNFIWALLFVSVVMAITTRVLLSDQNPAAPQPDERSLLSYLCGLVAYFTQITGTPFGQRDPTVLLCTGAVTLLATLVTFVLLAVKRSLSSGDRIAIALMVASFGFLALFTIGRARYGLLWAVFDFHMGPLLPPLFAGLVLSSAQAYDLLKSRRWFARSLMLVPSFCVVLRALISFPDAGLRAHVAYLQRVQAEHTVCTPGSSPDLSEGANVAKDFLSTTTLEDPLIRHLCQTSEPKEAHLIEDFPPFFSKIIAIDPEAAPRLHDLWESYQTNRVRLILFPVTSPDAPKLLLSSIKQWALDGANYGPETLTRHNAFFKSVKID